MRGTDSALWIDGRIGCGKSVLCGRILESLQSPVDGRDYAVIAHAIDPVLPSETNTACVIKALLWQILQGQLGSVNLHRALANLLSTMRTGDDPDKVEMSLWDCLQIAIGDVTYPAMLVIDGLSELDGGEAAATVVSQTLLSFVNSNPLVRLVVLSRPFNFSPATPLRRRTVEAKDVHKDIHRVITDLVPSHSTISSVEITRRIDHQANGSFLWSLLTFQDWATQGFPLEMWKNFPTSLDATAALLVSKIDLSDQLTCRVLFSSIVAIRPLHLTEVEVISRLDVKTNTLISQAPDVQRAVQQSCRSLLVVKNEMVLFRHALLKQTLHDTLQIESLSLSPEMHADMARRLLLYMRLTLVQHSEPSLKLTPWLAMEALSHSHPLLPYALRYWTSHVVASTVYDGSSLKQKLDLRPVFPDTVSAAIVEASFWTRNLSRESLQALRNAASMRREILGNHEATLQTAACLAEALRCTQDYAGAAINFGIALDLAQQILTEFHPFTTTCMSKYLDVADKQKIPDSSSKKAYVLRYLCRMYSAQHGPSSDQAMSFANLLADHYAVTQEYTLSTEIYQDIHRLTTDRHGRESSQAKVTAERLFTAIQCQSKEGSHPYSDLVYDDILQTYDVIDPRRIKASIAKAESYRSLDDPFNAELVYISLWHGVAEACHRQEVAENHEKLIDIGIAYAKFLAEYGRMADAQTVLLRLWSQQQALEYRNDTTTALLGEVALEMKHCGLKDIALVILNYLLAYYGRC